MAHGMMSDKTTHKYLDLSIYNTDAGVNFKPVESSFDEYRNNPMILNCNDYFISLVRFKIDTATLPLMVPIIQVGQNNVNKTIYSVSLEYEYKANTYTSQKYITFETQHPNEPIPNAPLVQQDVSSLYYYVNSYTHFIELVNNTLASAHSELNALVVAAGGELPHTKGIIGHTSLPPFLEFDADTYKCILNGELAGYNKLSGDYIKVYMNNPLYTLFHSLQATTYNNATLGRDNLIDVYNIRNTNVLNITADNKTIPYLQMYQEFPTLSYLNPISSVVIRASIIPVEPSLVSTTKITGSYSSFYNQNQNNLLSNIVSDFEIPLDKGFEWKPTIYYSPQSEYRLFDLFGFQNLQHLQLSAMWKDKFGILRPILLGSNCSANFKLMFRKKSFNNI